MKICPEKVGLVLYLNGKQRYIYNGHTCFARTFQNFARIGCVVSVYLG